MDWLLVSRPVRRSGRVGRGGPGPAGLPAVRLARVAVSNKLGGKLNIIWYWEL